MQLDTVDWAPFERRFQTYSRRRTPIPFAIQTPTGQAKTIGDGEPAFRLVARDRAGMAALRSFDQFRVAVAYLDRALDIDGDMLAALSMRRYFGDFHPISWVNRFLPAAVRGSREHDRKSITAHYDREPEFFMSFLDTRHRCYTQGSFAADDEPLEDAVTRKLDTAIAAIGVGPGDHVLDIGGGWGAFVEHAGKRGIRVTTLTLSEPSERYLRELVEREGLPATVVREHVLRHTSGEKYDAIVNMGVTEHLPNYRATLRKYEELLRPGGRVYLDALAMRAKHRLSTFMSRYVYPGTSSPLLLHSYLKEVARSPFTVVSVDDERHNYYLTCRAWAERLDAARERVVERWGEALYRNFRLFLWGSAAGFRSGQVQAYRWVLELPGDTAGLA